MDLSTLLSQAGAYMWGWPLIITMLGAGFMITLATNAVQIRYFSSAWRLLFAPKKGELRKEKGAELSPLQAFLGALGTSIGNGNIAGIATGIAWGGPGAAFWILVAGFFGMAIRFSEVFLGTFFSGQTFRGVRGGPMVYLSKLPGKSFTPYLFAFLFFMYALTSGNAMQSNSIGDGIFRTWGINKYIIAASIFIFLVYAILGGAQRILRISDWLTPFKVLVFLVSAIVVLLYHYNMIIPTFILIFKSAFSYSAFSGGAIGFSLQQAMKNGLARALNANEAGLGSAALFFGASGSKKPVEDSIMSMCGVFISTFVVCFLVALIVLASGVWNNGEIGSSLAISAYETVFGTYGGWVVTFIAASFGLGVLVAFLFIGKTAWLFLTNNRWPNIFYLVFCIFAFLGTIIKVDMIWNINDLVNGILIVLNLYAYLMFMPFLRFAVAAYQQGKQQ